MVLIKKKKIKHKQGETERDLRYVDAYKKSSSLGDDPDSINNPWEIPEKGQQQTNPKLHLN
jgi:hypothetical protein